MADIENIKSVVAGLRAGIADGSADMDAVASGLQRVENLLQGEERTDPSKRAAANSFARKKRKEGDWKNPLNA